MHSAIPRSFNALRYNPANSRHVAALVSLRSSSVFIFCSICSQWIRSDLRRTFVSSHRTASHGVRPPASFCSTPVCARALFRSRVLCSRFARATMHGKHPRISLTHFAWFLLRSLNFAPHVLVRTPQLHALLPPFPPPPVAMCRDHHSCTVHRPNAATCVATVRSHRLSCGADGYAHCVFRARIGARRGCVLFCNLTFPAARGAAACVGATTTAATAFAGGL